MKSLKDIWREALLDLRPWKKNGIRAVHKPLFTLVLLGRASRKESGKVRFVEVSSLLTKLLKEFGPQRQSHHPEYPFWHLQNNGFWVIKSADSFPLKKGGSSPTKSMLIKCDALGFVEEDLWGELVENRQLRNELVSNVLFEFWPETLHAAIKEATGIFEDVIQPQQSRKRDPKFRENVLRAYRGECAVCSFDGRLAGNPLGVQAAHVRWHAFGGPDEVSNGLALCAFHHLALDTGALGLNSDLQIIVSCDVSGNNKLNDFLYKFEGQKLRNPQPGMPPVSEDNINWHSNEVFKKPGRVRPGLIGGASIAADLGE